MTNNSNINRTSYIGSRNEEKNDLQNLNDKLEKVYQFILSNIENLKEWFKVEKEKGADNVYLYKKGDKLFALPPKGKAHLCHLSFYHNTYDGLSCFMSYIHRDMLDEIIELEEKWTA